MSELSNTIDRPRRRHRSSRRKLFDSLMLVVGAPCLIFAVLALSVELIEYAPAPAAARAGFIAVASPAGPNRTLTTRPIVAPKRPQGMLAPLDTGIDTSLGQSFEEPLEPAIEPGHSSAGLLPID